MVSLQIKVVPKSSRDRVLGWMGDRLKVAVTAAPEKGKANAAVVALLAEVLGVARSKVAIVSGEASALKTISVDAGDEIFSLLPRR